MGFRGKADVESPYGQWTRLEVIAQGDRVTNIVNGKVVAEGSATDADIDLSWLAPGVYITRVQGSGVGGQGSSQKVVVTR